MGKLAVGYRGEVWLNGGLAMPASFRIESESLGPNTDGKLTGQLSVSCVWEDRERVLTKLQQTYYVTRVDCELLGNRQVRIGIKHRGTRVQTESLRLAIENALDLKEPQPKPSWLKQLAARLFAKKPRSSAQRLHEPPTRQRETYKHPGKKP